LGSMVTELRNRALGLLLLIFALPCCVPMPPGIPAACGVAILFVGVQMLLGRQSPWIPRALADRDMARADLQRLVDRSAGAVKWLERLCRPRLAPVTGGIGKVFIGLVVSVLAVILILPIPFVGNIPPGIATAIIGLGLAERDGLVVAFGFVTAAVALAITSTVAWGALLGLLSLV